MAKNKNAYSYVIKSFGIILFAFIIYKTNFSKLFEILSDFTIILPLIITVILLVFSYLLKAMRWRIICKGYGIEVNKKESFRLFLIGTFLGFTTPGRVGELFRANYLKHNGNTLQNSLATVITDRIVDLSVLLCLSFASILFLEIKYHFINQLFFIEANVSYKLIFLGSVLSLFAILILAFRNSSLFKKFKEKLIDFLRNLKKINLSFSQLLLIIIYTLCSLIIGYGLFYYLAISLDINIYIIELLAISILVSFIQLLPISILGIGTRDITLIYFFHLNGLSTEMAVSLSFLVLFANIAATTPGLILFLSYKKQKST